MEKYHVPKLETERLILRAVSLKDAEDMFDYASQDKVTYFTLFPKHESVYASYHTIQSVFVNRPNKGWPEAFAIVLKENNKMIGTCDFWPVEGDGIYEMGYVLNPDYWNLGIMSEAGKKVVDFAFNNYGVRRMELNHLEGNFPSQKVALKLGFIYEGRKRKSQKVNKEFKDQIYYGLLKEDLK